MNLGCWNTWVIILCGIWTLCWYDVRDPRLALRQSKKRRGAIYRWPLTRVLWCTRLCSVHAVFFLVDPFLAYYQLVRVHKALSTQVMLPNLVFSFVFGFTSCRLLLEFTLKVQGTKWHYFEPAHFLCRLHPFWLPALHVSLYASPQSRPTSVVLLVVPPHWRQWRRKISRRKAITTNMLKRSKKMENGLWRWRVQLNLSLPWRFIHFNMSSKSRTDANNTQQQEGSRCSKCHCTCALGKCMQRRA